MNQNPSSTFERRCRTTVIVLVSFVCYKCCISLERLELSSWWCWGAAFGKQGCTYQVPMKSFINILFNRCHRISTLKLGSKAAVPQSVLSVLNIVKLKPTCFLWSLNLMTRFLVLKRNLVEKLFLSGCWGIHFSEETNELGFHNQDGDGLFCTGAAWWRANSLQYTRAPRVQPLEMP